MDVKYSENDDNKNHDLVKKQHLFYDVFRQITHRSKQYSNINKYKALLLQAEAYLYELLTFKDN